MKLIHRLLPLRRLSLSLSLRIPYVRFISQDFSTPEEKFLAILDD